jgi:hypothetical protein
VRSVDRVWTHEFDLVQDIIPTLRDRLAHLALEGLRLLRSLQPERDVRLYESLRGEALRLAIEKPVAWPNRLFARVLTDEIERYSEKALAHDLGLRLGSGDDVPPSRISEWLRARIAELRRILASFSDLLQHLNGTLNPDNPSPTVQTTVFLARNVSEVYANLLAWANSIRCAQVHECYHAVTAALAKTADDLLSQIVDIGPMSLKRLEAVLPQLVAGEDIEFSTVLRFDFSNEDQFHQALKEATDCYIRSQQEGCDPSTEED